MTRPAHPALPGSLLERAGLSPSRIVRSFPLSGGTYNTLHRVELHDGDDVVVKIAPPPDAPGLTYERSLLIGEETFYRAASGAGAAPVPRVLHTAEGVIVVSAVPGRPWHTVADHIDAATRARLRRDLGGLLGRLHLVTGPGFGYPGGGAPLAGTWREAFTAMTGALLDDALRLGPRLPFPAERIRALVTANADVLEEVRRPALVHFDLWDGNILLDDADGTWQISALVDGERMFWGDPLADLVSPALLGEIEDDDAFLHGYRAAGPGWRLHGGARTRLALYRCYLYLIMLTEAVPRGTGTEGRAWLDARVAPELERSLGVLLRRAS